MVPPKKQNGETQTLLSICENSFTWSTALLSILGIFICSACSHVCATVNAATTFAVIQSHIQDLETTYPDSFNLMASDFNHVEENTTEIPTPSYVCNKMIDLFHIKVKDVYTAWSLRSRSCQPCPLIPAPCTTCTAHKEIRKEILCQLATRLL